MKRFNKSLIYYRLIMDFIVILLFLFMFATNVLTDEETLITPEEIPQFLLVFGGIFLVAYIVKTVYNIFYYKTSGYELKDNEIVCKRGVFFRKKSILEYAKIHAVNKKQNIIHKIFKLAVLTLDSGSANTATTAEILIIEKDGEIDKLLSEIKARQNGEYVKNGDNLASAPIEAPIEERENLYSFTAKKRVMYSVLNLASTLLAVTVIAVFCLALYSAVIPFVEKLAKGEGIEILFAILFFAGITYILSSVIVLIVSVFCSIFAYYKFRLYKNDSEIEINYGFFVKNSNTFKLNRIKGVVITQGIIQRLFKFVTVKLEVIGYSVANGSANGNENAEIGVLFPLCKESEVEENLLKVLPSYVPVKKEHKAKKYFPFISWALFGLGVFTAVAFGIVLADLMVLSVHVYVSLIVLVGIIALFALISILITTSGLLAYKNNGIAIDGGKITATSGSFFKKTTVIYSNNIVAVEDITTPLRKKNGIYSYKIHFRSNAQTNVIKVENLDECLINELRGLIKY